MVMQKQAARRLFIDIAKRRARPGTGSNPDLLRERTTHVKVPDLSRILEGIPWAAAGAIAARSYMRERSTQDLDIAVFPQHAAEVAKRLTQAGFTRTATLTIGGSSWNAPDGFPVDVIELHRPWATEALQAAQQNIQLPGLPVLPLPYLVLMKFEAGRLIDMGDIGRMLGQATQSQLEDVRRVFRRYNAEGLDDLESLITLGRMDR